MRFNGDLVGFNDDLMGFHDDLYNDASMGLNGDLMGLNDDLMMIQWDLMVLNGVSMGLNGLIGVNDDFMGFMVNDISGSSHLCHVFPMKSYLWRPPKDATSPLLLSSRPDFVNPEIARSISSHDSVTSWFSICDKAGKKNSS